MNENNFPDDINQLIQKCEERVAIIKSSFSQKKVAVVKDLYSIGTKVSRSEGYYTKLNVTPEENNEIKGLYIFAEIDESGNHIPIYVGISRSVFRRLRQHAFGKNHNQASFCYMKAKHSYELPITSRVALLIRGSFLANDFLKPPTIKLP